jgi:hypothetical protein
VGFFRRQQPLHRRLAQAGDMGAELDDTGRAPSQAAQPPGWDGEARGEPGIHGVPRVRRWDAVATAEAPGLSGDAVRFVGLADGSLVVTEDEPVELLEPLAEAVDAVLPAPYSAEAVRRSGDTWAVGASRIVVLEMPGLTGEVAELAATRDGRTLHIDGRSTFGRSPELERVGEAQGAEYVVRATRLDGDLWQVEATAL